jgi:hypothetical protein
MIAWSVPCPICKHETKRLRGFGEGTQERVCEKCKYKSVGHWQFVWNNKDTSINRKELDRLNEKPKSWDQLYDEQLKRWQPEIKRYKTAIVPSREEWIAEQQAEQVQEEEKELKWLAFEREVYSRHVAAGGIPEDPADEHPHPAAGRGVLPFREFVGYRMSKYTTPRRFLDNPDLIPED